MNPGVQILHDRRVSVAFCPQTLAAQAVDKRTARALDLYARQGDVTGAARRFLLAPAALARVLEDLGVAPPRSGQPWADTGIPLSVGSQGQDPSPCSSPGLERLVLAVSGTCNLSCRYCYAAGGAYGAEAGHMPREIALAAVNWALTTFGGINNIQFFGGEPLTNPRLIVEVCEYCRTLSAKGHLRALPRFSLVTNGTLADERTLKMLKHYAIGVTISIDGPEAINDALRGKGTFEKADRFARACLDARTIPTDFECTFTGRHLEEGLSMVDLVEFFAERYGHPCLHVVPVTLPAQHALALKEAEVRDALVEAASHSVRALAGERPTSNSFSQRIIESLRERTPFENYCPAGVSTLAVASDGGLYPCFMLTGRDALRICRFQDDGTIADNRQPEVSALIAAGSKQSRPDCRACWARPLCSGCIGADLIATGDITRRPGCETMRALVATVILEIAALQQELRFEELRP